MLKNKVLLSKINDFSQLGNELLVCLYISIRREGESDR